MANITHLNALNPLVVAELATGLTNMVSEIVQYKRAIAELELQREQMRYQAQIAMRQIDVQLHTEIKRIDALNHGLKKTLKQNQQLIDAEKQNQQHTMQLLNGILAIIGQCQDVQQRTNLIQMYSNTLENLKQSGQHMSQLGQMLHDTYQQFGISVSRREQDWRDIS